MATTTCPACGAHSATADYCDSCGAALGAGLRGPNAAAAGGPPDTTSVDRVVAAASDGICPNCGAARTSGDAFCEGCGLDFATGDVPSAAPPPPTTRAGTSSGWVAVIEADRPFFDSNVADSPSAIAFPDSLGPRQVPLTGDEVVIGRRSEAKGFFPAIDLSSPVSDPGVSHRHAALRRQADGSWAVVDDMSTNGTWLNGAGSPLDHGVLTALHDGDRINLGSFTRITIVREAPTT